MICAVYAYFDFQNYLCCGRGTAGTKETGGHNCLRIPGGVSMATGASSKPSKPGKKTK